MRKSMTLMLALLMCLVLSAHAETVYRHDIVSGSLIISESGSYSVYTTDMSVCYNQIIVKSGVTAQIELDDVTMGQTGTDPCILIEDGAEATLVIKNWVILNADDSPTIQVDAGKLTICGDGRLTAETEIDDDYCSAIGSAGEFSGTIHITGDVEIEAIAEGSGAAIGTGRGYDIAPSGSILIDGNAHVTAVSESDGAGIGSGENGDMLGKITICGNAVVEAVSEEEGAGIGAGEDGSMGGTISIGCDSVTTAQSEGEGAGIGSGAGADMSGAISVSGNAEVDAQAMNEGAGIGSGHKGAVSGTVSIGGNADVRAQGGTDSAGIGGGDEGEITSGAMILISGNAKVTAIGQDDGTGVGAGKNAEMAGTIIIKDQANVGAYGGNSSAAIGAEDDGDMTGTIKILNKAVVTAGVADDDGDIDSEDGVIGDSEVYNDNAMLGEDGSVVKNFVISVGATINGISGKAMDELKEFVDFYIDQTGSPEGLQSVSEAHKPPETGDESRLLLWAMMVLMGGAMTMILSRRRAHA